MSKTSVINIKTFYKKDIKFRSLYIIEKLLANGWTLNDNGKITYLPLGDIDDFDWKSEIFNRKELADIIMSKEQRDEVIGVVLTWKDTMRGGSVLFHTDSTISFGLDINRKVLECSNKRKITDINWYLERIMVHLDDDDIGVEYFSYEEY